MLKYLSLFSGIGAVESAMNNLGINYELIGFSEIDKYAIKSYCALYDVDESLNLGDIRTINIDELKKKGEIDLISHGSPCFPAGTKVLTDKGYKCIEDINIEDMVLTHTNEYKKVCGTMINKSNDIYKISTQCSFDFMVTGNHPFLVRKKCKKYKDENNNRINQRYFKTSEWKQVKDLNKDYYIGVAINQNSNYPKWDGVTNNQNNNIKKIDNLKNLFNKNEFWYFVGRFIGDGWITEGYNNKENKPTYRVTICCSFDELENLENKLKNIFNYTIVKERTVYKLQFQNKELVLFLKQFGHGANNKHLTDTVLDLPKKELEAFLNGYLDSDGNIIKSNKYKNTKYKITSISEDLILGIGMIIAKLYNTPFSIYKTIRPKKYIIEGRIVNQHDTYEITFFKEKTKTNGFYENNIIWMPIRNIEKINSKLINVYNLEVEDNHSYTVNNIIVHNCQDFSVAGKGKGGDKDSGTRSSLMWYTVGIIEKCKPKYILWENVKNLLSKKHKHNFDAYIETLENLGYNNYYKILNAKDYGIPQNRERVFTISIRKDIDDKTFEFPEPFDNGLRLKDLLDKEVDEKYYINSEKASKLIEQFIETNKKQLNINPSGKGMNGVVRNDNVSGTITTNKGEGQKILVCGKLNSSQDGVVCNTEGISPTHTAGHGNCTKIVCPCITPDRLEKRQHGRRFKTDGEPSFTITTQDRHGILEADAKILCSVRTEYGKQIRKDYESGNIDEKRSNMTMLEPRNDNISNTLTTVTKDNLLLETNKLNFIGGIGDKDIVGDDKKLSRNYPQGNRVYNSENIACSQTSNGGGLGGKTGLYMVGMLDMLGNEQIRRVYDEKDVSPTLSTMQGGNTQPKVLYRVKQATKQGYAIADEGDSINLEQPNSTTRRGRVGNQVANTLTCSCNQAVINQYRIRKLTPSECWKLMGFHPCQFNIVKNICSNSQLYKQAGNSICVNVLEELFYNLFLIQ